MFAGTTRFAGLVAVLASFAALSLRLCLAANVPESDGPPRVEGVVSVVLVGATDNLAKKYLWQGLHDINADGGKVYVFPGATKKPAIGQQMLDDALVGNITASSSAKNFFIHNRVHEYSQLRSSTDYAALGEKMRAWEAGLGDEKHTGRLIYLSVPPKFYGSIAQEIDRHLRPSPDAWLRVIVEKPFGTDLDSARELAASLDASLLPREILLVDHYLGKPGVEALRGLRAANKAYDALLSGENVKSVEIVMSETEDCEGRTGFYDDVGVLRDVMQNHLTMMAAFLTVSSTLRGAEQEASARAASLKLFPSPSAASVLEQGQYVEYTAHNDGQHSSTPTYASVRLEAESGNWANVPFYLVAGKALASRHAYTKIIFTSGEHLLINVQGNTEGLHGPAIRATRGLPSMKGFDGWHKDNRDTHVLKHEKAKPAYEALLFQALTGQTQNFVRVEEVLESWRIWTPLLMAEEQLQLPPLTKYRRGGVGLKHNHGPEAHDEL